MKRMLAFLLAMLVLLQAGYALAEPVPGRGTCGKPYCYWETPMDISDPETVWNVLIQPMTVVSGNQRTQVKIYSQPDKKSQPVGEVTCHSQGVHVLENLENGWSLVECYSSSNGRSKLKVYGDLIQGYIQTELLVEHKTKTKFGLVADKLTQRLYIFRDGELFTTLRISTGEPVAHEPERDTNAGEFHLVSFVGPFLSENGAVCEYSIRFNDGDLLHAVPYTRAEDGTHQYTLFERDLGKKASNGCIRVQRKRSPEGVNMKWIWNNMFNMKQTKLLIWEDLPGRQIAVPDAETPVYVLMGLSNSYHKKPNCYDIDKIYFPMEEITYGQLEDGGYCLLNNCPYCNPPLRVHEIEEINRQYAVDPAVE